MGDHQKTYPIEKSVFNIGRRENNDLVVPDPRVSREHAQIRVVHGECILFDLNSTGGTSVNGQRISTRTLRPGDMISFAVISFIFGEDAPSLPSSTGTSPTHFPV
jgi:pSer/pThr/pTyr-binding forkhead associated (FHA) protein